MTRTAYRACNLCEAICGLIIETENNKVVSNLAGSEPTYTGAVPDEMYQTIKAFQYPHDVCVDDEENLYVAQWNSGKTYPFKLEPVV